ncbi:hypothetical protein FB451DRAFT_1565462 [Mycena latifolia]|nr:hypothetical protein FB451DRAFT_1565462 [Mycena latifolia]
MHLPAILFNPSARVYNLRFLLLVNLATAVYFSVAVIIVYSALIYVHHVLGVFKWRMRGLAAIDLALITLEIGFAVYVGIGAPTVFTPHLVALVVSAVFRTATIIKSKGGIWSQRFEFLGCCPRGHPEYTALTIFLNRSLARPLVRGESRPIILARAVVLSCIILGVPAFGVYAVFILPLAAQSNTAIVARVPNALNYPPGNAIVYLTGFTSISPPMDTIRVTARNSADGAEMECLMTSSNSMFMTADPEGRGFYGSPSTVIAAQCPYSWVDTFNITISITISPEIGGVYVHAGDGYLPWEAGLGLDVSWDAGNNVHYIDPLLLLPGSRLIGVLSWTQRDIITQGHWGISTPRKTIFTWDLTSLQPYPATDSSRNNIATLILLHPWPCATKLTQDTLDATPLSGVATLGGFWAFVNGAFALLFGANVIYFAFGKQWECFNCDGVLRLFTGRRPLSALGVVHIFQRRALVRRWHEDFPAIHTEGGTPGSESAGIVAFIRERLVDLGENPRLSANEDEPRDVELQTTPILSDARERRTDVDETTKDNDVERSPIGAQQLDPPEPGRELKPEYRLDEVPQLDIDLEVGEIVKDEAVV